jgi:IMP dehydrogenase/GMP reductase
MIDTNIGYGYNDLCLVPCCVSDIKSRSECVPFYANQKLPIFASPMSAIVNVENFHLWEMNGITPILPRNIDYNIRYDYLRQGKWVAFSLTEFEDIFIKNDDFLEEASVIPHVLIDVANGHMQHLIDICKTVKKNWNDNIVLMAGNIANPETYREYCEAGIDYVRCSIGSGSCCTTASNTAVHYPIASLIDKINEIKKYRSQINCNHITKVIADGGIRNYSDVIKALALGADYVMIGGLFNSILESAGEIANGINIVKGDDYKIDLNFISEKIDIGNKLIIKGPFTHFNFVPKELTIFNNCEGVEVIKCESEYYNQYYWVFDIYNYLMNENVKRYILTYNLKKEIIGMSTKKAQCMIKSDCDLKTAEGISKIVDVKYTMKQWTENMIDYLKSAMSYCGCRNLTQFIGKQTLKVQTNSELFAVNK